MSAASAGNASTTRMPRCRERRERMREQRARDASPPQRGIDDEAQDDGGFVRGHVERRRRNLEPREAMRQLVPRLRVQPADDAIRVVVREEALHFADLDARADRGAVRVSVEATTSRARAPHGRNDNSIRPRQDCPRRRDRARDRRRRGSPRGAKARGTRRATSPVRPSRIFARGCVGLPRGLQLSVSQPVHESRGTNRDSAPEESMTQGCTLQRGSAGTPRDLRVTISGEPETDLRSNASRSA